MDFSSSFIPEPHPAPACPAADLSLADTISSLMAMADKMEALLPPELDLTLHVDPSAPAARFADCVSSVTTAATAKHEPLESLHPVKMESIPLPTPAPHNHHHNHQQQQQPSWFHQNVTDVSLPATTPPPPQSHHPLYTPNLSLEACSSPPASSLPASCSQHSYGPVRTTPGTSPVGVRDTALDLRSVRSLSCSLGVTKANNPTTAVATAYGLGRPKPTRKPKTYSKPVASRFCHICSRMPRRGQGSATCRRMAEGFCRKIVCEQCLREQGWNYDDIAANPGSWLCPHCADNCPPRSQCHIYNRINARRKRAGKQNVQQQQPSVATALASSDVLLGPYGHLLGAQAQRKVAEQILQPPPNFRLNLPPQYSQQ